MRTASSGAAASARTGAAATRGGSVAILTSSHDGYRRLQPRATHRRTFTLERTTGRLEILDELVGAGTRLVESFLRLAPGAAVRRVRDILVIEQRAVRVALQSRAQTRWR